MEKHSFFKSFEHQLESLLSLGQAQEQSLIPSCTCWEEPFPSRQHYWCWRGCGAWHRWLRYHGTGSASEEPALATGNELQAEPIPAAYWSVGFVLTQPCWTTISWTVSGSLNTDLNDWHLSHLATRPWEMRQNQDMVRMSALAAYESRSWTGAHLLSLPPDGWPGY